MTTNWNIGIDWRRKGVICWTAQPGDALNILPQPVRYTTLDWRTDSADSISRQVENTDFGTLLFAVQSGTGVNNGYVLGQSDGLDAWISGDLSIPRNLEQGKSTLAYAADNWVQRRSNAGQADTFNVFRALKDTVAAERGRL